MTGHRGTTAALFLLALAACVAHGGSFQLGPLAKGKGLGSDAEIAFYAAGPGAAFEKYLALWKTSQSDRCDVNAKMMTCTAAVAGGGAADDKRLVDAGIPADDIMSRSYATLLSECANHPDSQSEGARSYAEFYRRVQRVGLGLPYGVKAVELASAVSYEKVAALTVLADVYDAMGWFEQRDEARWRAIETGREYFKFDPAKRAPTLAIKDVYAAATGAQKARFGPAEGFVAREQIRLWNTALRSALEELSWSHDARRAERMRGIWADLSLICSIELTCMLVPNQYPQAAVRFARAGDVAFAQGLYDDSRAAAPEWVHPGIGFYNFEKAAGALAAANGKLDQAADHYETWLSEVDGLLSGPYRTGVEPLSAGDYTDVGLADEAAGRLDKAIAHLEKSVRISDANRSSFDVQSRLRFLRGRTIRAYWGLVRSYAARYLERHDPLDLDAALRSASMLNSRQLGEALGIDQSSDALSQKRLGIRGDELVLVVVETNTAIVSFGLTGTWKGVSIFRGDVDDTNARIRRVKAAISRAGGAQGVSADLAVVGAAVLSGFRDRLARAKALTVITDGAIAALPFGLLPESDAGGPPLVAARSVAYAPSLPYLASSRSAKAGTWGAKTLAVGDPKYGPIPAPTKEPGAQAELNRAVSSMRLVVPLPETRAEATSVFNAMGGRGALLLGADASESRIKSLPLSDFGFIHLATHGVLGNQLPGLHEPALLFAAEGNQDAFLTMSEVEALHLRAKLTVLSACDTGSGEYFEGEGVMGLGRAFLLAGSRAVVATLWPIASDSTVDFMKRFYARLVSGMATSEALRATQVDFIGLRGAESGARRGLSLVTHDVPVRGAAATAVYSDPYYWAPFVLLGGL